MKLETVTIQHLPIELGNDGAIDEFEHRLADGLKKLRVFNDVAFLTDR